MPFLPKRNGIRKKMEAFGYQAEKESCCTRKQEATGIMFKRTEEQAWGDSHYPRMEQIEHKKSIVTHLLKYVKYRKSIWGSREPMSYSQN